MDCDTPAHTAPSPDRESGAAVIEYLGLVIVITMMTTTLISVASDRVRTEMADIFMDRIIAAVEQPLVVEEPAKPVLEQE